ncbi:MAG: NAD(P)-dependent oxidoreductase [Candidatus Hodarchaeota archaeon]
MDKLNEGSIKVCFIDHIPESVQEYLKNKLNNVKNIELVFSREKNKKNILKKVSDATIIVGWHPTKNLLKSANKMKLFINPGAGVRHLIEVFREINQERKVILVNGHGNSYFVAQHAIALLLALMNKVILHHDFMKNGIWRTGDKEGASIPLRFRKVGLLGYGAINQKVHKMLSGFEIELSILRRDWRKQKSPLSSIIKKFDYSQLKAFLREIDVLIIAVPSTSLTENMIKMKELELLGPNGILVNVSRGDVVNEENLYFALKNDIIAGAAIDVWYNYTPKANEEGKKYPYNYPFHQLHNIILSPHRGYSPFNDLKRWDEVIENILRISKARTDLVNVVSLSDEY